MIVIKDGPEFSKIYADKAFDKWGNPTMEDIRIVEEWNDFDIPNNAQRYDANKSYDIDFKEYCDMIENTLWIFNNEKIKIKEDVYMTGGGIQWMFQTGKINIFDISKVQVNFINSLIKNWNGQNYGQFVYDFIKKNKVIHFHINLNEKQDSNKKLFADKNNFIKNINENFEFLKNKYNPEWCWDPSNITVYNENLIPHLPNVHLGKALISNIFDFKYYFVKSYVDNAYAMLSPSSKSFIRQNTHYKQTVSTPACQKLELNVPVNAVYEEIHKIKKYLRTHRSDSGIGWQAFCIHGQAYDRTKEDSYYDDFIGHKWTPEALEHMPLTIKWLKSLGYKSFKRVRVMCLLPKGFINLHKDQNHSELGAVNVAINNPKDCKFYLQNYGILEFKPGTAYKLDLSNYHTVINNSNIPRYHIIIHGQN